MPRDPCPVVLITPLLLTVLSPPSACMASEFVSPLVDIVPALLMVFDPVLAATPFVSSVVVFMLPVLVIVSVLLPFSVCVDVVLPVIIVSAAIALNCWVKMPAHVSALNKNDAEGVFILADLIVVLWLIP